jgi:hypothetical protein
VDSLEYRERMTDSLLVQTNESSLAKKLVRSIYVLLLFLRSSLVLDQIVQIQVTFAHKGYAVI